MNINFIGRTFGGKSLLIVTISDSLLPPQRYTETVQHQCPHPAWPGHGSNDRFTNFDP